MLNIMLITLHPLLYGHIRNGQIVDENTISSTYISNVAYNSFSRNDRVPAIVSEAANVS